MWDPPIEGILKAIQADEVARYCGVSLWHNCNHVWAKDGDWDQAVVCCTRFVPWSEDGAEVTRAAEEQGLFARRPGETSSLYEPEAAAEEGDEVVVAEEDTDENGDMEEDTEHV